MRLKAFPIGLAVTLGCYGQPDRQEGFLRMIRAQMRSSGASLDAPEQIRDVEQLAERMETLVRAPKHSDRFGLPKPGTRRLEITGANGSIEVIVASSTNDAASRMASYLSQIQLALRPIENSTIGQARYGYAHGDGWDCFMFLRQNVIVMVRRSLNTNPGAEVLTIARNADREVQTLLRDE